MKNIRLSVKKRYSKIAKNKSSCCSCNCKSENSSDILIKESDLGLSCGDPIAFSKIRKGMIVIDLGCGAGKDVFIAAKLVGKNGKVIGIDMTDEMIKLARKNAKKFREKTSFDNVEFIKGFIENIPIKNNFVDLVISNCVINLSPDKEKVFSEIYRVLKTGGEMIVSDVVLNKELPENLKKDINLYTACFSGALLKKDYISAIRKAGFKHVRILSSKRYFLTGSSCSKYTSNIKTENYASSITLYAKKEE